MPQCGNCGKQVATSDIVCPHCGVLLAAYASPTGSGAPTDYTPPPAPPVIDIPSVDLDVPPPSETSVVTNPAEVAEEKISTAPRPLFDTNLTVEAISKAAEGDHSEDVLTLSEEEVRTKKVEFEVPDYARPPVDAAPIPIVEDAVDATAPVIRRAQPEPSSPVETSDSDAGEDESDSDPDPEAGGESWLNIPTLQPSRPRREPRRIRQDPPKVVSKEPERSEPVGRTDAYLRKLHEQTGYTAASASVSQPVESQGSATNTRRRDRNRNRQQVQAEKEAAASAASMRIGCMALYFLVLFVLWFAVLVSAIFGNMNMGLILLAALLTVGYQWLRKLIDQVSNS